MNKFVTGPSKEVENGTVKLDDSRWVKYSYDGQGRVSSIYTYNSDNTLLGYCVVTYMTTLIES